MESFAFGRNWKRYVRRYLDDGAVAEAEKALTKTLGFKDLTDRTFLDIGSGSGLHSLVAHRLGARRVVSFDEDPASVEATRILHHRAGFPHSWSVMRGSVLDEAFLNRLGQFDVVYSWGVLHHTGQMWRAIQLASQRLGPSGRFLIAIYNRDDGPQGSEWWLERKRRYVQSGRMRRAGMFLSFVLERQIIPNIRSGRNPFAAKRKRRGMGYYTDVLDWVGGYPYEFASKEEVERYCIGRLGLEHVHTNHRGGLSNNEFVFDRLPDGRT